MLFYCWASVVDGGPALKQHWSVPCVGWELDVYVEATLTFKALHYIFYPLEFVSSYGDPKFLVAEKYSYLFNL